jgi:hypothetical protein
MPRQQVIAAAFIDILNFRLCAGVVAEASTQGECKQHGKSPRPVGGDQPAARQTGSGPSGRGDTVTQQAAPGFPDSAESNQVNGAVLGGESSASENACLSNEWRGSYLMPRVSQGRRRIPDAFDRPILEVLVGADRTRPSC